MKKFIACFTPLHCEAQCGSLTYGYIESKWIFENNRFEERVVCGGCNAVQSREYTIYLDSEQYAEDMINNILDSSLGDPHQALHFLNWFSEPRKEKFQMALIKI